MGFEKYGIFSPAMGLREDFPSIFIDEAFVTHSQDPAEDVGGDIEGLNVQLVDGEIHRAGMRLQVLTTAWSASKTYDTDELCVYGSKTWKSKVDDNTGNAPAEDANWTDVSASTSLLNPILKYYWFEMRDGNSYLFTFTKKNVFKWAAGNENFIAWCDETLSECTNWQVITFNDKMIATNQVNHILAGDDVDEFAYLGSASGVDIGGGEYLEAAKYLISFENYVFAAYTTEASSTYPQRIRWCDTDEYDDWSSGNASYADVGNEDYISGLGKMQDFMFIFKENAIYRLWLSTYETLFDTAEISNRIGCLAADSIVNGKQDDLYFLASDYTIRELHYGEVSRPIDRIVKRINPEYVDLVRGKFVAKHSEIWWAIPYGPGATANNLIICMKDGKWTDRAVAAVALGEYERTIAYTWDDMDWNWDDIGWLWDDTSGSKDFRVDLVSDSSGNSYAAHEGDQDAAASYEGYFVLSTDLTQKQRLNDYKRVLFMHLYFRRGGADDTVDIYARRDHKAWETVSAGESLPTDQIMGEVVVPCDLRCKHLQVQIRAANHFEFLGVVFDFVMCGDR